MNILFKLPKSRKSLERELEKIKIREVEIGMRLKAYENLTMEQLGAKLKPGANYEDLLATSAMSNVAIATTCIDRLAESISTFPIQHVKVDQKTGEGKIDETPYSRLLKKPNKYQTYHQFIKAMLIDYYTRGISYIYTAPFMPNLDNLWILPAANMSRLSPLETWKPADTYQLSVEIFPGVKVLKKIDTADQKNRSRNLMTFDNISDTGQWVPAPVLNPIMKQMTVLLQMQEYQSGLFANMPGLAGVIYMRDMGLINDDELEKYQTLIAKSVATARNAGRTAILPDVTKFEQWNLDWSKLGIEGAAQLTRANILAFFKIPAEVYGGDVSSQSTYNNVETAWKYFYRQTLIPFITRWLATLNDFFYPAGDYRWEINNQGLPDWLDYCKAIDALNCLSINEKRHMLGFPPVGKGEHIVINNVTLEEIAGGQQKLQL